MRRGYRLWRAAQKAAVVGGRRAAAAFVLHARSPPLSISSLLPRFPRPLPQVLAPYDSEDARGLLKAAIRDPDPVVFLENEILYGEPFPVSEAVLDKDFTVPIGKAKVCVGVGGQEGRRLEGGVLQVVGGWVVATACGLRCVTACRHACAPTRRRGPPTAAPTLTLAPHPHARVVPTGHARRQRRHPCGLWQDGRVLPQGGGAAGGRGSQRGGEQRSLTPPVMEHASAAEGVLCTSEGMTSLHHRVWLSLAGPHLWRPTPVDSPCCVATGGQPAHPEAHRPQHHCGVCAQDAPRGVGGGGLAAARRGSG